MEEPECFVCFHTAPPLHRVCLCNTLVHPACLTALERVLAHRTHCPVCRQPYTRRAHWCRKIRSIAGTLCTATVLAAGAIGLIGWSQYWVAFQTAGGGHCGHRDGVGDVHHRQSPCPVRQTGAELVLGVTPSVAELGVERRTDRGRLGDCILNPERPVHARLHLPVGL